MLFYKCPGCKYIFESTFDFRRKATQYDSGKFNIALMILLR